MAGPHTSGTASFQTNPLLPTYASVRRFKPRGKRPRPRLPTNFAPEPVKETGSPDVEVLKVVSVNRQTREQGKEPLKPAVKPAIKPAASISTTPAKYRTLPLLPKPTTPAQDEPADVIDLTSEPESPKLAPMKPAASNTSSHATPLPPINQPPRQSYTPTFTTFQPETWSLTSSGRIQLPEPRQSHSAGYHPRHQGPRYKVLPAGFGGLELARGHRGIDGKTSGGQGDEKVRKEMLYTLKRHVEEYWQ